MHLIPQSGKERKVNMAIHETMLDKMIDPENVLDIVSVRLVHDRLLLSDKKIKSHNDAVELLRSEMEDFDREHFVVLTLQSNLKPINATYASIGAIDSAPVAPREIFKTAILSNAAAIICLHNHPSGQPDASREDSEVTERLMAAAEILGIKFLDHIVVGKDDYYSFKEAGMLDHIHSKIMDRKLNAGYIYEETEEYGGRRGSSRQLSFREKVAEAFVESLKAEPKEWVKAWASNETGAPYNMASERPYRGINAMYLKFVEKEMGFSDPRWLTFNQAKDAGYKIPKGTKMTPVEYFFMYDRLTKKSVSWQKYNSLTEAEKNQRVDVSTGQIVTDNTLMGSSIKPRYQLSSKEHYVFNASQLEGVPEYEIEKVVNDIAPSAVVNAVAAGMGVVIDEKEQDRAFYSPSLDRITLPLKTQFDSDYDYQSTALHELGHATGHPSRLDRDQSGEFGSAEYAYEELVAEITSCYMGEYLTTPMSDADLENHAAYVQHWITRIEKDPNYLMKAIKEAEKAADYMIEKGDLESLREDQLANEVALTQDASKEKDQDLANETVPNDPNGFLDIHTGDNSLSSMISAEVNEAGKGEYEVISIDRASTHPGDDYLHVVLAQNRKNGEYATWVFNEQSGDLLHGHFGLKNPQSAELDFHNRQAAALRPPYRLVGYAGVFNDAELRSFSDDDLGGLIDLNDATGATTGKTCKVISYFKTENEAVSVLESLESTAVSLKDGKYKLKGYAVERLDFDEEADLICKETITFTPKPLEFDESDRRLTIDAGGLGHVWHDGTIKLIFERNSRSEEPLYYRYDFWKDLVGFPQFAVNSVGSDQKGRLYGALDEDQLAKPGGISRAFNKCVALKAEDTLCNIELSLDEKMHLSVDEKARIKEFVTDKIREIYSDAEDFVNKYIVPAYEERNAEYMPKDHSVEREYSVSVDQDEDFDL